MTDLLDALRDGATRDVAMSFGRDAALLAFGLWVAVRYAGTLARMAGRGDFGPSFRLAIGIAATAAGVAANRGYWAVWRVLRTLGEDAAAAWMSDRATLLLPLGAVILFGYAFHLVADRPPGRLARDVAGKLATALTVWSAAVVGLLLTATLGPDPFLHP